MDEGVIDDFPPSLTLSVSLKKEDADLGNNIKSKRLHKQPTLSLYDEADPEGSSSSGLSYVVTLVNPDASSRDNPEWP
ncbi:Carboxypeptidase Y inhibitor [Paraphaeosphaeria minitans]|uniref:Carboxypeptidase Y inhibitor n=1 Tax=Paraphaeosphaeria minitans TaxID=565426 RepID=A0A9P6GIA7_9PLEO|nr:Carboxypeptidase Y inhibitor [Paraphaeosphaeria minitans]